MKKSHKGKPYSDYMKSIGKLIKSKVKNSTPHTELSYKEISKAVPFDWTPVVKNDYEKIINEKMGTVEVQLWLHGEPAKVDLW